MKNFLQRFVSFKGDENALGPQIPFGHDEVVDLRFRDLKQFVQDIDEPKIRILGMLTDLSKEQHPRDKGGKLGSFEPRRAFRTQVVQSVEPPMPTASKTLLTADETTPTEDETLPPVEKTATTASKTGPTQDETTTIEDETAPPVYETAATADETTPSVEKTAQTANKTLSPARKTPLTKSKTLRSVEG